MSIWLNRINIKQIINISQVNETEYLTWFIELHNNNISTTFYLVNEHWITTFNGLYCTWAYKLFKKKYTPEIAAKMIERAYQFNNKKKK